MDQLEQMEACRICVNCFPIKDMDFINIFQANPEFQQELNFIQGEIHLWKLKINADDGLPQKICANCFAKFCSIGAFRKECELTQNKLIEALTQQTATNELDVKNIIKNTEVPLPLVGNYGSNNISLDSGKNVLISSINFTQNDDSLNDFHVFDQQFSHFDNPALIDSSSTLLDCNLIAPESSQELALITTQNLFTFEAAEASTKGALSIDETSGTSIVNEVLVEKPCKNLTVKPGDLEDVLHHSIIPTSTKSTQQRACLNFDEQSNGVNNVSQKSLQNLVKPKRSHFNNNHAIKFKSEYQNTTISFFNHEESNSDNECDDSDMNARLKGLAYACHYCFCPEEGSIEHLIFLNDDALSQHFFDVHDPNQPYTCPNCPQSFNTKLLRDNHVKLTHKSIEYQTCDYCKKRLKGSPDIHQYNCQYIDDWECEECKEQFPNTPLYRFRLHQRQHDRTTQFKCRLCERSFVKKANLVAHQKMHKELKSNYTCKICKACFADENKFKLHNCQQHKAETILKCKFCNKGFSSNVFLQRHINKFHPDNVDHSKSNVSLSVTSLSLSSASVPSSTEQHVCMNCNMAFKTLPKLQQHLQLGYDKNGNCMSTSCSKEERRKIQRQGVFPCFHCPRRFHLRSQLDKHLNTHDARLRPYPCKQCITRCRTICELKQHVNVAHLNIKAFSCDKCGKCFGYKKDLRDHMLFHSEINVFCTEEGCDYACKNDKALNDHIRHKHRLLSCEYCKELFTRQKLTAHLRKMHRSEIDIELARKSEKFYKYQLLNNNNDVTQISFNLINNPPQDHKSAKMSPKMPPSTLASQTLADSIKESIAPPSPPSKNLLLAAMSAITSASISSSSSISSPLSSLSSGLVSRTQGNNLTSDTISTSNVIDGQICAVFGSDCHDSNGATMGLVSTNDTDSMFLGSSTVAPTNDNPLDQYYIGSLMDSEQEIIVT